MIRTAERMRMGVIVMGAAGSAAQYTFDPDTGLSNDPRLAYYLQDLTPAQLQTALDGKSPNKDLISLFEQAVTGTGAGSLPCGSSGNDPNCDSNAAAKSGVPTWAWIAGAAGLGLVLLGGLRR